MATDDLFSAAAAKDQEAEKSRRSNVPEMSVSDLAQSLKRTLEDTYGRVRVRGELSGLKLASSGHLYGDLKDMDAAINIVCWKGTMSRLAVKPADGLDVIVTGKMTSFPKNSRYQLVIDQIEFAGEGALLKMLEDRRRMLSAEGLFDEDRKRDLPFLPDVIGVVTSPTGAVIRDILHRLSERFPRHVLLWPVAVQGEGAAAQVAAAIRGFNAHDFTARTGAPRPDLLIVARGGGSLEDLMAFNEESVVRAAAASDIPLISAVGHETDTTLIDYAADLRAPTPTGAAERAVPVRAQLLALVREDAQRVEAATRRIVAEKSGRLQTLEAKLGDPEHALHTKEQSLDNLTGRHRHAFEKILSEKAHRLARLTPSRPETVLAEKKRQLENMGAKAEAAFEKTLATRQHRLAGLKPASPAARLDRAEGELSRLDAALGRAHRAALDNRAKTLDSLSRMLESLSFRSVLKRGYAVVRDDAGALIPDLSTAKTRETMEIEFHDGRMTVQKR